ncbi:rhamnulokinase [Paenibacillus nasutitermitis]|uniref:Rhamnulokinase n=1 Tax=Paenibacillus nasutitermitis TaxID=1652958 RepID=A0A917DSU7_9BACL|nr:rhamnulokinase family protein [Paenibacillus nasutitermitis]GGD65420.1 rhamnulokinase [Paenibacillus nasutitermitis]
MKALAFDLGAGSGRAVLGWIEEGRIVIQEVHRFSNEPVQVGGRLHWDILRLYHEIKQGIRSAWRAADGQIGSIGIDSWAVDFGLIGRNGELLANPYHYRDSHTANAIEEVLAVVPETEVFARSGIQFLPFNTLYQLHALKRDHNPALEQAEHLLMIPDLLRYFLTGEMHSEFTNATTTQAFNPTTGKWDERLLSAVGVNSAIMLPPVQPGTEVGRLSEAVTRELGVAAIPLIAVGEHDTASAVAGVPALQPSFAYLSCGTWSLMGTEVKEPVLSEQAQALNFTNEGGVYGTYRLLKNIMGLWLQEESKRSWEKEAGTKLSYSDLLGRAEQAEPFRSLIDPDDLRFLNPSDMPAEIAAYCRETGQPVPASDGEIIRCILESLALKYRFVFEKTQALSGAVYEGLHMVGGGIQNEMLCRFTAGALGKPVWAGPAEGSVLGNLAVQFIASGEVADITEARKLIGESFDIKVYEPEASARWNEQYGLWKKIAGL